MPFRTFQWFTVNDIRLLNDLHKFPDRFRIRKTIFNMATFAKLISSSDCRSALSPSLNEMTLLCPPSKKTASLSCTSQNASFGGLCQSAAPRGRSSIVYSSNPPELEELFIKPECSCISNPAPQSLSPAPFMFM